MFPSIENEANALVTLNDDQDGVMISRMDPLETKRKKIKLHAILSNGICHPVITIAGIWSSRARSCCRNLSDGGTLRSE